MFDSHIAKAHDVRTQAIRCANSIGGTHRHLTIVCLGDTTSDGHSNLIKSVSENYPCGAVMLASTLRRHDEWASVSPPPTVPLTSLEADVEIPNLCNPDLHLEMMSTTTVLISITGSLLTSWVLLDQNGETLPLAGIRLIFMPTY